MNKREKEIAAVAAAVASGCVRCLQYHKKAALVAGITNDELLLIARLAFMVRGKADEFNRGELDDILTEGEELRTEKRNCLPKAPIEGEELPSAESECCPPGATSTSSACCD
ncbi:MAG: carboxymuconolactone decarboxylase family protein [Candidatus Heimdallarchaeota archaeon]